VLEIEHGVISSSRALADIVVNSDYSISVVSERLKAGE
jgi:hypothetical protein